MLEFKTDTNSVKLLIKDFKDMGKSGKEFFNLLGIKFDQMTQLTFRLLGARSGMPQWRGYSPLTLHPSYKNRQLGVKTERASGKSFNKMIGSYRGYLFDPNRWNRRRGTDNAKGRLYSDNSQMLQASGSFRKSFNLLKVTEKGLVYGTRHKKALDIMGANRYTEERQVLFFTPDDHLLIERMFRGWINKKTGV